ncbi:MAG: carbohydrate kinase family protein [Spirochaetales bacterium]|nr:carbohydrate kinase family protein [Spirochaetales bacterium]
MTEQISGNSLHLCRKYLAIGHCAVDINMAVDGPIEENRKYRSASRICEIGGPATNASILMALWGGKGLSVLGTVIGRDMFGDFALEQLKKSGVVCDYISQKEDYPTPVSCILSRTDNGMRTIVNHRLLDDLYEGSFPYDRQWLAILCDGHCAMAAEKFISEHPGVPSVLDAGSLHAGTKKLHPLVDYVAASETYAESVAGMAFGNTVNRQEMVNALDILGGGKQQHVVITRGAQGAWFYGPEDGYGHVRGLDIEAVDTTGAGDIFHGAFTYCTGQGLSFVQALVYANAAAGLSCKKQGGSSSIPALTEVQSFISRIDPGHMVTRY